jgi:hypothetical protein
MDSQKELEKIYSKELMLGYSGPHRTTPMAHRIEPIEAWDISAGSLAYLFVRV